MSVSVTSSPASHGRAAISALRLPAPATWHQPSRKAEAAPERRPQRWSERRVSGMQQRRLKVRRAQQPIGQRERAPPSPPGGSQKQRWRLPPPPVGRANGPAAPRQHRVAAAEQHERALRTGSSYWSTAGDNSTTQGRIDSARSSRYGHSSRRILADIRGPQRRRAELQRGVQGGSRFS